MPLTNKNISIIYSEKLPFALAELRNDGILKYTIIDNYEIQKQDVLLITSTTKKIAKEKRVPILFVGGIHTTISSEAFEVMDTKESLENSLAEAYVIKSTPQRLLADFYLKIKKPYVPTSYFSNEEKALVWLTKFFDQKELVTFSQEFI